MTYTEQDIIDDMEYVSKCGFMIMRYLALNGPRYRSSIMQELIREFPDEVEHGPGLFGKEYSDDLWDAFWNLRDEGIIGEQKNGENPPGYRRMELTPYGRDLYEAFAKHPEVPIDEDLCDFLEKIEEGEE